MVVAHQLDSPRSHLDQRHVNEYVTFQHVSHIFTITYWLLSIVSINYNLPYIIQDRINLFIIILFSAVKSVNIESPRTSHRTNTLTTPSEHHMNLHSRTPKSVNIQTPPTSQLTNTLTTLSQHHMNLRSRTPKSTVVDADTPRNSAVPNLRKGININ